MGPESEPQGKRCLGDRGRRAPGRFASNRHGWAAAPPWKPTLRWPPGIALGCWRQWRG